MRKLHLSKRGAACERLEKTMRSSCCRTLVSIALLALAAAARAEAPEPRSLEHLLYDLEAHLATGDPSPHLLADVAARLRRAAPSSVVEDLLLRLAAQLEPLAAGVPLEAGTREQLLAGVGATLGLARGKLSPGTAVAPFTSANLSPPPNDACPSAAVSIAGEVVAGTTIGASDDGGSSCGGAADSADVWFSYTAPAAGLVAWDTLDSALDTVLSLHSACPGAGGDHELACSDDARGTLGSLVARDMAAGETVLVRVSGAGGAVGDFRLGTDDEGGGIAGTVNKQGTGEPRPGTVVSVHQSSFFGFDHVSTGADGGYLIAGLPAGDWYVRAQDDLLVDEVWNDRPCIGFCDLTRIGDPVVVGEGLSTGIDFALAPGGSIAGTVLAAEGGALTSVWLSAYDATGGAPGERGSGFSDGEGRYEIRGLAAGSYTVLTSSFGYHDELYDDVPCEPSCAPETGTPIEVQAGSTTPGIDFSLSRFGSISGTISRAADGAPVFGWVGVYDSTGSFLASGGSLSNGSFRVENVPAGHHFVRTDTDELDEVFDGHPCEGFCDVTTGDTVRVASGTEASGVHFVLEEPGRIEGTVVAEDTAQPLDVDLELYDASGGFVDWRWAFNGSYVFSALEPGHYYVRAISWWDSRYEDQMYDDVGCDPSCDVTLGDPVTVAIGTTISGVDFVLPRCKWQSHETLSGLSFVGSQTRQACRSIHVGPNVTIEPGGALVLRAGRSVSFADGFAIAAGGRLEVAIDPAVGFD
jgi:hypothetical protein